ncbi:MAG: two-component regulator propeller domain-containing protein, partial [Saprospiraceae bacterium]
MYTIKKSIFTSLISTLLLWCGVSISQPLQLRFENYTKSDGLSDDHCKDIFKDSRGFIWIATRNGLNRFDGSSFQNFFSIPSDSNALAGSIIRTLTEMPGGLLVIGTNNGLCIYNIYKNRFENFRIKRRELSPGNNVFIRKIFCDADKNLWVNYNGVIDVFDSLLNYK